MAKSLGIAPVTLRRYLTGERLPSRDLVARLLELAQASGHDVDEASVHRAHAAAVIASGMRQRKDKVTSPVGGSTSRRDLLIGVGAGVLTTLVGIGVTWYFSADQEVRAQRAVEDDQRKQAAAKPPLRVNVGEHWRKDDNFGWIFPKVLTPDQEHRLSNTSSAYAPKDWATQEGGVRLAAGFSSNGPVYSRLRLSMENQWIKPVLVTEIRARVRRSAPWSGALVWAGAEGGTVIEEIGFDLDEPDPFARMRNEDLRLGEPYADRHAIPLEPAEIVPLDVLAQTTRHYCEWDIEFTVQVDGVVQKVIVDNGGKPFRTTAFADHYDMRYFFKIEYPGSWYSAGPGGKL